MALKSILRKTSRLALGVGIVGLYYESGLWKDSDTTVDNYERLKRGRDEYLSSVPPVVKDIYRDLGRVTGTVVGPVTEKVSDFKKNWLTYDLSWTTDNDGILKPTWNKGVSITFDFLAHSPETVKSYSVRGWNKLNDVLNNTQQETTTTATVQKSNVPEVEATTSSTTVNQ